MFRGNRSAWRKSCGGWRKRRCGGNRNQKGHDNHDGRFSGHGTSKSRPGQPGAVSYGTCTAYADGRTGGDSGLPESGTKTAGSRTGGSTEKLFRGGSSGGDCAIAYKPSVPGRAVQEGRRRFPVCWKYAGRICGKSGHDRK